MQLHLINKAFSVKQITSFFLNMFYYKLVKKSSFRRIDVLQYKGLFFRVEFSANINHKWFFNKVVDVSEIRDFPKLLTNAYLYSLWETPQA